MHWLIPFAFGLSENASQVLHDLALPNLARLLRRLTRVTWDDAEPRTLSPPHERAFAAAVGWQAADGALPFAAFAARQDGVATGAAAWGLVTPCHWLVGRDHVTMADPVALELDPAESRAAFDAVRDLFEGAGIALAWGAVDRWYAAAEEFAELPCASLDRVIGRAVEAWLPVPRATAASPARSIRRLQSEFQMWLYSHPLNDARQLRGALTLNSFWLSGCGREQPMANEPPRVDDRLRAPLLADDWVGWAEAWRALDAGPLAEALAAAAQGDPVTLTLCGERNAHRFETGQRSVWQRLGLGAGPDPQAVLGAL